MDLKVTIISVHVSWTWFVESTKRVEKHNRIQKSEATSGEKNSFCSSTTCVGNIALWTRGFLSLKGGGVKRRKMASCVRAQISVQLNYTADKRGEKKQFLIAG